jgi:hypothetical protein
MAPLSVSRAASHVVYEYTVVKSGISHKYGLKVNKQGKLLYLHGVEKGEPQETKLPQDKEFSKKLFLLIDKAGKTDHVPCGAHRFGKLYLSGGPDSKREIDLYKISNLKKYGDVARLIQFRLQPLNPKPIYGDCLALGVPPKVSILKKPGDYKSWFSTSSPHSPKSHFISILDNEDEDEREDALLKIVVTSGSDPFFLKYLMLNHRISGGARESMKYHGAIATFSVSDPREAKKFIKLFNRGKSLEKKYFSGLLYLLRNDFERAAPKMRTYFTGIGRVSEGEKESKAILSAQEVVGRLNYGKTTWSRQIHSIGFMFDFWYKWAQRINEPNGVLSPLAKVFYQRAFHYARMFAGNLKVGSIPATPRGRRALKLLLPIISAQPWWLLPVFIQNDILKAITAMRFMPKYFGGVKELYPIIPPLAKRVYEITKMRRFRAVYMLMQKYGSKMDMGKVYYAKGKALFEEEKWEEASNSLKVAFESGESGASEIFTLSNLELGKIDLSESPVDKDEILGRLRWYISQNLFESGKVLLKLLAKEELTISQKFLVLKMKLISNSSEALKELSTLSKKQGGGEIRLFLGELSTLQKTSWSTTYDLVKKDLYGPYSARAWGILAVAAWRDNNKRSSLWIDKALDIVKQEPLQMISLLNLMVRYGIWPVKSYLLSVEAIARYQYSSELAWLRAVIFLRSSKLEKSSKEIRRALKTRPLNQKYLKIKNIIEKLKNP